MNIRAESFSQTYEKLNIWRSIPPFIVAKRAIRNAQLLRELQARYTRMKAFKSFTDIAFLGLSFLVHPFDTQLGQF